MSVILPHERRASDSKKIYPTCKVNMSQRPKLSNKYAQLCKDCQGRYSKSLARCPHCGAWDVAATRLEKGDGTVLLSEVDEALITRIETGPWDPVFGSHIDSKGKYHLGPVCDSVNLIGGVPGAGKSTLALQLTNNLAIARAALAEKAGQKAKPVLLISAEESAGQIKARAMRLKLKGMHLIRLVSVGEDVDLTAIIEAHDPCAIVGDSVQKICPDIAEAVEFCGNMKEYCVQRQMPAFIISHVNKGEELAGLMQLQHEVDMTALFTVYDDEVRELRAIKNRNGPSGEKVLFDMTQAGLVYREPDEEDEDGNGNH